MPCLCQGKVFSHLYSSSKKSFDSHTTQPIQSNPWRSRQELGSRRYTVVPMILRSSELELNTSVDKMAVIAAVQVVRPMGTIHATPVTSSVRFAAKESCNVTHGPLFQNPSKSKFSPNSKSKSIERCRHSNQPKSSHSSLISTSASQIPKS